MKSKHTYRRTRTARPTAGFTLVELLMVIVIIAILVGLGTAAFVAARGTAINASMTAEIEQMVIAIEQYRNQHGDYFPNPFTIDGDISQTQQYDPFRERESDRIKRFEQHLRRAFPRYLGNYVDFQTDVGMATSQGGFGSQGLNVDHLDSAEVLVFFLAGLPNKDTETRLTGFAADPQNPFRSQTNDRNVFPQHTTASARTKTLFEFNANRLQDYDQDGWYEYVPDVNVSSGQAPPYVYFDFRSYAKGAHYPVLLQPAHRIASAGAMQALGADWGYATPYLSKDPDSNPTNKPDERAYVKPKEFQIICCGRDGKYSDTIVDPADVHKTPIFPDAIHYESSDYDNLANFTRGTLEGAKP